MPPPASMLANHIASRYVVPLREGGSLPAVIETETGDMFVVKFRGAGQGARAIVAELIVGLMARRAGVPMPELALVHLDPAFERTERDQEIQDILRGSHGVNVGLRYLDGAFAYDPLAAEDLVHPDLAADIVWLDALTTNIDRTARNTNILVWRGEPWLIDHGAALFFHHSWSTLSDEGARRPFEAIADHVLLSQAGDLRAADERMRGHIDAAALREIIDLVPDALLAPLADAESGGRGAPFESASENREAYYQYFLLRLESPRSFVDEAVRQQAERRNDPARPLSYRR